MLSAPRLRGRGGKSGGGRPPNVPSTTGSPPVAVGATTRPSASTETRSIPGRRRPSVLRRSRLRGTHSLSSRTPSDMHPSDFSCEQPLAQRLFGCGIPMSAKPRHEGVGKL